MYLVWDGLKSLIASLASLLFCGVPAAAGTAFLLGYPIPDWALWPLGVACAGLAVIGLVLSFGFARKAWRGVSPGRDRRR